jgi:protein-disulfide isomerase
VNEPAPRRRPRTVGLIALALVVGLLLAGIASLSLDEGDERQVEIAGAGETQKLYGGIAQDEATLGSPDAPVEITLFNDMQCADCDAYQLEVVPPLVEELVRPGDARLTYRHFSMGERPTGLASFGAIAAGKQGKEWNYVHIFFLNQDDAEHEGVTEELLRDVARAVLELDTDQWDEDLEDADIQETIDADNEIAADLRLPAEPAVLVDGPRGTRKLIESPSFGEITAAVEEVG